MAGEQSSSRRAEQRQAIEIAPTGYATKSACADWRLYG